MTSGCFSDTGAGSGSSAEIQQLTAERSGTGLTSRLNPAGEPDGRRRLDAGRDHDFPGVVVGIAEIAGVTAVLGLVRGLSTARRRRRCEIQRRIDFLDVELQFQASVAPRKVFGRG
jgi:hypothetical protein